MVNTAKIVSILAGAFLLASCGSGTKENKLSKMGDLEVTTIDQMDVIASRTGSGDNSIIVAEISAPETPKAALLLSDLADDVEIVRLDQADEALVRSGSMWISDKRFIIYDGNEVKQFDRSGKYLGKIGSKGNGPGEYFIAPYDVAVDEANGRIYLLAYNATKILSYDLDGEFTGDIPLAHAARKGFIDVNPDGTLTISALTFDIDDDRHAVWRQDLEGNMIEGVRAAHLAVAPDFSNEIFMGSGEKGFTYSLFRMDAQRDTIYEYTDGALKPLFTADFGDRKPMHNMMSFPGFYVVDMIGEPVEVDPGSYVIPSLVPVLIDKKTLRGGPVELVLDFIGPVKVERGWIFAKDTDYFGINIDPGDLEETLRKTLEEQSGISESDRARITELIESISPDDNNYLIVGKWKK